MKILKDKEQEEARKFIDEVAEIAKQATCERSRCGAVIVKNGEIIGKGYNSPPGNLESQRRCHLKKDSYDKKVTDKTCCVHAEQRAIMDALKNSRGDLKGSRLYFIRLDENGQPQEAGEPYCTICSKMVLDAGIEEFTLLKLEGITVYKAEEYNDLSFKFCP